MHTILIDRSHDVTITETYEVEVPDGFQLAEHIADDGTPSDVLDNLILDGVVVGDTEYEDLAVTNLTVRLR